jgi:hypothetical protein
LDINIASKHWRPNGPRDEELSMLGPPYRDSLSLGFKGLKWTWDESKTLSRIPILRDRRVCPADANEALPRETTLIHGLFAVLRHGVALRWDARLRCPRNRPPRLTSLNPQSKEPWLPQCSGSPCDRAPAFASAPGYQGTPSSSVGFGLHKELFDSSPPCASFHQPWISARSSLTSSQSLNSLMAICPPHARLV